MFPRDKYYSKTEVIKKFKISSKKYDILVKERGFSEINTLIDLGHYQMTTRYVLKKDIDTLNLLLR